MLGFAVPELDVFRADVRRFFAADYPQEIIKKIQNGERLEKADHIQAQQALDKRGWLGLSWPKEDGGTGWSATERFIFDCEMEAAGAPGLIPMGIIYIGPIICAFGTAEQKARWLPDILESKAFWAQGYSEPESGSDLASLRFSARRDGDDYILNGTKIWTSGAHWADWIFCLARTSQEARKQDGISMICVDLRSPGVSVHPITMTDGSKDLNQVEFDNVRVPAANRIGDTGRGWHYANVLLKNERLSYAHIGAKRRDLRLLRELAIDQPDTGSRTMAENSAFKRRVSDCEIRLDMIEMSILRRLDSDIEMAAAAMLKIACTELAQEITELAIELAGPDRAAFLMRHGSDWASVAPHIPPFASLAFQSYLFERAQTIYGGSTEIQKNIIWRGIGG